MKKYNNIYVAASNQHVGKTTNTLGLVATAQRNGINVGYCKPVGQKFLDLDNGFVDKDTVLFADLIDFDIKPEYHSPVVLPGRRVRSFIDGHASEEEIRGRLVAARQYLESKHELTIYEGTGHPGVGSVAGLSNADVAKLLQASVIMVLEGGIGSTIDMFHMCSAVFREQNVPIVGVIINKVKPEKTEKVSRYLQQYFDRIGIPILGIMPYDRVLAYPLMSTVAKSIKGKVELNEDSLFTNRVENILAGSLVDLKELDTFENHLLIASSRTIGRAISRVQNFSDTKHITSCPISGVIVTGTGPLETTVMDYLEENKIPLIRTNFDTYGVSIKVSQIEVKINRRTPWKVSRAIDLFDRYVDMDRILIESQSVAR